MKGGVHPVKKKSWVNKINNNSLYYKNAGHNIEMKCNLGYDNIFLFLIIHECIIYICTVMFFFSFLFFLLLHSIRLFSKSGSTST